MERVRRLPGNFVPQGRALTLQGPVTTDYLRAWARHTHRSPLYGHLIELTATHPGLLRVAQRITNRPPPNVYLAAIHYLLMEDPEQALASFYQSLTDDPLPVADVDEDFVEFVLSKEDRIVQLANTRLTQTNECRRCVALLPGVMTSPFESFHLVEMGTSAGLNLAMDLYGYDFDGLKWGPNSDVVLEAKTPGEAPRLRPIEIKTRTGIDLNIIDRADPVDRRWLDALIWPEHEPRRERLRSALALTAEVEMKMVEGSALELIEPVLSSLPPGEPAVVMNSFVLIQFDEDERSRLVSTLEDARSERPIYRVSLEFIDKDDDWARLEVGDGVELVDLGRAHPHGEWVDLSYPG